MSVSKSIGDDLPVVGQMARQLALEKSAESG
jgi:hypothetical protein